MKQYFKTFEIRWDDLDPNRHVANNKYSALMTHTRMSFMNDNGWSQQTFMENNIGPVVLSEEFHYLKEVFANEMVKIDLNLLGQTEDKKFAQFSHSIYNSKDELAVYGILTFGWFDLKERKIIAPSDQLLKIINKIPLASNYRKLTNEDIRKKDVIPKDKFTLAAF